MVTVKKHPVMEAVVRKLAGVSSVPVDEQLRMVQRAAKVAADIYDEQAARIAELKAEIERLELESWYD